LLRVRLSDTLGYIGAVQRVRDSLSGSGELIFHHRKCKWLIFGRHWNVEIVAFEFWLFADFGYFLHTKVK